MDSDYDTPMGDVCDECKANGVNLTGCGECEMRYCDECAANYVTDAGCPACARLEEMIQEVA